MFVTNHAGVVRGSKFSRGRIVNLCTGENVVIAGCPTNQQYPSIAEKRGGVAEASLAQVPGWSKRLRGRVIQLGGELGRIPGGVTTCDQHLTALQQGRRQALSWSHQASGIFEGSGLRIIKLRGGRAPAFVPTAREKDQT